MAASAGELPCFRPDGRQRFVVIQTAPADGPDHRHRLRYAPHGNRRKRPPATHRRGARHGRNTRVGALPDTIYRTGGRFGHRRGQAFEDERSPVGNDALRAAARGAVAPYLPLDRVVLYDERFTSAIAHRAMLDGGLRKMARRNRALVDKISATIILEDFMSSRRAEQHR